MKITERDEQIAVIQYCDYKKIPIFAIPNGGSRHIIEAKNLKREGVRAGVPDLCIPLMRGGYGGLYIEMKSLTGRPTELQKEWQQLLIKNGYLSAICKGFNEAKKTIDDYIKSS